MRLLMDHANRPLTVVMADAGYGKTTLLAAYARALARPVVWYSLMSSDADLVVFGRYLLEGFRRQLPRFGRDFHLALEEARPGARSAEMLAGTLVNELATLKGGPYLLVLDDFQNVAGGPGVVSMTSTLLAHLPPQVRLVLASRAVPPLSLERMRAGGQVFELDSSQLRFTRDELARLFSDVYRRPLNDQELDVLEQTTLGWPTAVHLVFEMLRRSDQTSLETVLADFRASNLELHDYLSAEVYGRLDPPSRRLLERTAALSRFDVDLATALAGDVANARGILETLVRRGLLRTFGNGTQASYECHDLVGRFIRHEIESLGGVEAWRGLEADSALALAERGEPERAMRHFLAAGRATEAAALLRGLAPRFLREGRATSLLQHLTELPQELVAGELPLSLALADAHQALGQWDQAESRYQEILERSRQSGDRATECLGLLGLGKVHNLRGRYEQVLGMAERGLAIAHTQSVETRARLLQMKAGAHFYLGQYRAAEQVLGQVRSMLPSNVDLDLLLPAVHNLATAYAAQGKFREALQEFRSALAQVRGTASPRAPLYLSNLAYYLAELGELSEARRAAEEGLQAAQRFSNRVYETACHSSLAHILIQSGDVEGSLASLKKAEELNAELRMEMIAADLLMLRGRIFCARGEFGRGLEFLTHAIALLESRPDSPQLVDCTATLAWCELRAGRVRAARDRLVQLQPRVDATENDFQRTRVHYWLAETLLALGDRRGAESHLARALRTVRERGYHHFLRSQARDEPAPLLHALSANIELGVASAALVDAGTGVQQALLELVREARPAIGEASLSVLAEVGGKESLDALEKTAKARRVLQPAIRTARRRIDERISRGAAGVPEGRAPRLTVFGPPQLLVEERPVPASVWRAQRAFHLLIYLILHPRGASKEELLEHFWPGRQLAAGKRNFHPTLSYVRKVLPRGREAPILRENEFYRYNPAYPLTCDAWDFERALEEARAAREPSARRRSLERAVKLANGRFLEGMYGRWAEDLESRMRDRLERAWLELGALSESDGDHEAALGSFRRAGELDEFRETTRLAVIRALVRLGNRGAAVVEYERFKSLLKSELGVDPMPETDKAVRQLVADAPEPKPARDEVTI